MKLYLKIHFAIQKIAKPTRTELYTLSLLNGRRTLKLNIAPNHQSWKTLNEKPNYILFSLCNLTRTLELNIALKRLNRTRTLLHHSLYALGYWDSKYCTKSS